MLNYTIVLNAVDGDGTNTADKTYPFDFSSWENGAYNLSFTYVGNQDALEAVSTCNVYANLGTTTVFNTGDSNYANTTQQIGHLLERGVGGGAIRGNYLYDETNTNTPVYLYHKPTNQTINIRLLTDTGAIYVDQAGQRPANYTLTLHFQRV